MEEPISLYPLWASEGGAFPWASFALEASPKGPLLVPWMRATEFSQIQEQKHGGLAHALKV